MVNSNINPGPSNRLIVIYKHISLKGADDTFWRTVQVLLLNASWIANQISLTLSIARAYIVVTRMDSKYK